MYSLRTISKDGTQSNVVLGNVYDLIIEQISPEAFNKICNDFGHSDSNIYAFVWYKEYQCVQPLFKDQKAYMMINGKTFDKL